MSKLLQNVAIGFVYEWSNLVNGKKYIGLHKGREDDGYIGSGTLFRLAINKYGVENFSRKILYREFASLENLYRKEYEIINEQNAVYDTRYYNLTNFDPKFVFGTQCRVLTAEHRFNLSQAKIGKKRTAPVTEKERSNRSVAHIGKKHLPETKLKISAAKQNPSDETRQKLSIAAKNRPMETLLKMSVSAKNRKRAPVKQETKDKISKSAKIRGIKPEVRTKMWESRKANSKLKPNPFANKIHEIIDGLIPGQKLTAKQLYTEVTKCGFTYSRSYTALLAREYKKTLLK